MQSVASAQLLDIKTATQLLEQREPLLVWQYLDGADPYELEGAIKEVLMRREREQFSVTLTSLRCLEMATYIYSRFDGAII